MRSGERGEAVMQTATRLVLPQLRLPPSPPRLRPDLLLYSTHSHVSNRLISVIHLVMKQLTPDVSLVSLLVSNLSDRLREPDAAIAVVELRVVAADENVAQDPQRSHRRRDVQSHESGQAHRFPEL